MLLFQNEVAILELIHLIVETIDKYIPKVVSLFLAILTEKLDQYAIRVGHRNINILSKTHFLTDQLNLLFCMLVWVM